MKIGLGVTHKIVGFCSAGILLFQPMLASAKCGGVDYSWERMLWRMRMTIQLQ